MPSATSTICAQGWLAARSDVRRTCRKCGALAVITREGVKQLTRCTACPWKSIKYVVTKGSG